MSFPQQCIGVGEEREKKTTKKRTRKKNNQKKNSFAPCQICLNPPAFVQLLTAINTSLTPLFNHFHFQFKRRSLRWASGELYSHCSGRGINDSQFQCFFFSYAAFSLVASASASSSSLLLCYWQQNNLSTPNENLCPSNSQHRWVVEVGVLI